MAKSELEEATTSDIEKAGHELNIGHVLKSERNEKGYSLEQVSEEIKIALRFLKHIENNELHKIPHRVYLHGYLKSYAKFLGIEDKVDVEAVFAAQSQQTADAAQLTESDEISPNNPLVLILFAILVAGGLIYYVVSSGETPSASDTAEPTSSSNVVDAASDDDIVEDPVLEEVEVEESDSQSEIDANNAEQLPEKVVNPDTKQEAPALEAVEGETNRNDAVETDAVAQAAQPSNDAVSISVSTDQAQVQNLETYPLVVKFTAECWVEIKDGNGKTILADLKGPDYVFDRPVLPPISILAGAAKAVEVTYNNQPVDIAPFTRKNVARIKLTKPE